MAEGVGVEPTFADHGSRVSWRSAECRALLKRLLDDALHPRPWLHSRSPDINPLSRTTADFSASWIFLDLPVHTSRTRYLPRDLKPGTLAPIRMRRPPLTSRIMS